MRSFEFYKSYKAVYKNYISALLNSYKKRDHINVILKSGENLSWNHNYVFLYSLLSSLKSNNAKDYFNNLVEYFEFEYNGNDVKLDGIKEGNGDIPGVFVRNDYFFLNPENSIVFDIGANIGDSSIYFVLNSAAKVIALEPYTYSYNFAIKNIEINRMENRITLLNAGYGSDCEIKVDQNKKTNAESTLIPSEYGKNIRLLSLKALISNYGLSSELLLKMDCEGCEYILLNEQNETLRKFKRIIVEYHYGHRNLIKKLQNCGFKIRYTKPKRYYNKEAIHHNMRLGYIYAELQ